MGKPLLSVRTSLGRHWSMPIKPGDSGDLQAVLDTADVALSPLPPSRRLRMFALQLLAVGLAVATAFAPNGGFILLVSALLAAMVPTSTASAMMTAIAAAHAVDAFAQPLGGRDVWFAGAFLAIAVGALLIQRTMARDLTVSRVMLIVPVAIMFFAMLGAWIWAYLTVLAEYGWTLGDVAVGSRPDVWVAPLAVSAGLLTLRARWAKWTAFVLLLIVLLLVGWTSGVFPFDDWILLSTAGGSTINLVSAYEELWTR
jgi:hypothetical protein